VAKIWKILIFCCLIGLCIFIYEKYFLFKKQNNADQVVVSKPVQLTEEELQWLKAHQPIRIAFEGNFPPYSFINESGKLEGISYDTIQLISQKLNIQLEIDSRVVWEEIYQAALDKEIDAIATMVNRPEREFQFAFTRPYVFKSLVIVVHELNSLIKGRSDLSGKVVALVKGYQYSEDILEDFPEITPFYVENMHDALVAVETQQADAAISYYAATYFIQNKYLLSHIKVAAFYDRNSANESIAVQKDQPILAEIFQKGLSLITEAEVQAIKSKWYPPIEAPNDYETIRQIVGIFLGVLAVLALWIGQIKYQSRKLKKTKNKLLVTNSELNDLKENLETQVSRRTKQLQNSEQKYRSLVENLRDEYFFYKHDLNGVITYLSPSFTSILGYNINDCVQDFSYFLSDHSDNAKVIDYTARSIKGEKVPAYEIEVVDNHGYKHKLEILETPLYDDQGQCIGVEGIAHDVTLLKQTHDRLNWLSYYDELTGLANRRLFKERFEQTIALSHRSAQSMALLFLDLDRFKTVNDSLGHAVGDEVLRETAERLKRQLRDSDISARMGGDEFTLILPDTDAEAAENVAKKVIGSLLAPYIYNDQQFTLGTSVGIAIYPQDGEDADTLLQQADAAMYVAKKTKEGYTFCSSDLNQISNRRLELEQALRKALNQNCYDDGFELSMVFQSKHDVLTNEIQGYEALMRWRHPELGNISPIEFIPLAEETGLIVDLSRWVITRVCFQAVRWSEEGFDFRKIAINISAVELINYELAKNIIEQIDATGAQREWIEIEITESALMKTLDVAIKVMKELVEAGILIAIDDFGTGYSSLAYLKNLPASYIKIDQSFIRNLLDNPEDQAVVKAVVAMSHALDKKVIAEGVETQEQLKFLLENGCDIVQGYLFSKPITVQELAEDSHWNRICKDESKACTDSNKE